MSDTSPLTAPPSDDGRRGHEEEVARWARWYEHKLGRATEGIAPVRLPTGLLSDVLGVPAAVGRAVLRRVDGTGPAASTRSRTSSLVAPRSAEEVPGLLDRLEWGGVTLSPRAVGRSGRIDAPVPPGGTARRSGAAAWLRPPGCRATEGRSFRTSSAPGAAVGMLPISCGSWTRWPPSATGPG